MNTMELALLLLLATLTCTAAFWDDSPEDIAKRDVPNSGQVASRAEGLEEVLTEILDDIEELNEVASHNLHVRGSAAQIVRRDTTYQAFNELKTFDQAEQTCRSVNGHLADIKTMDLQKAIEGLIRGVDANKDYWMGLSDERVERVWTWSDGTPIAGCDFTNWAPGEPNDGYGKQDCGQLWAYAGFKWDDDICSVPKYFVCQIGPGEANACAGALGSCLKLDLPSSSITSAGTHAANYGPGNVLDDNPKNVWNPTGLPKDHNDWWILFDLQKQYTFSGFKVQNYGDTTHDVTAFNLETSNDKSTWTKVFSSTSVRPGTKDWQVFFGLYGTGRFWRFTATRTATGFQPWLVGLQFCGAEGRPNNEAVTVPTAGITAAGTAGPQNGPEQVLDGNPQTYWNPQGFPANHNNFWIMFDLQKPRTLSGVQVTNYGDTTHDVTACKLEVSSDKVTWKPVYSTTSVRPGTNQPQMFGGFSGTGQYWRFTVIKTASGWQPWLVGLKFYTIKEVGGEGSVQGDSTHTHFHVEPKMMTHQQAEDFCRDVKQGHLADFKSPAIHNFVLGTIQKITSKKDYWIGLHAGNSGWEWADGTKLSGCSYTNWAAGEVTDAATEQKCVSLCADENYSWRKDYCQDKKFFVCQTGPGDPRACQGQSARELDVEKKEELIEDIEDVLEDLKEIEDEQDIGLE